MNKTKIMITQQQKTVFIFAIPTLLLAAAFIANMFVEGFNWSGFDFLLAGILLFGTAFIINFIVRSHKTLLSKILISAIVLLVLALVWAELAVGIFGTPFAGS